MELPLKEGVVVRFILTLTRADHFYNRKTMPVTNTNELKDKSICWSCVLSLCVLLVKQPLDSGNINYY